MGKHGDNDGLQRETAKALGVRDGTGRNLTLDQRFALAYAASNVGVAKGAPLVSTLGPSLNVHSEIQWNYTKKFFNLFHFQTAGGESN